MKRLTSIFIFVTLALISHAQGIVFDRTLSWSEILQRAAREQKYIFVDAWATWCGPCKMMDQQVYPDSAVGALMNAQFISVKVQFDQTPNDDEYTKSWYDDAKALNEKYKITGLPNFLFFTPDGALVHRGLGFQYPDQFIQLAKFASDPKRKDYYALMKNYEAGKKDYTVLPGLITTTREIVGDKDKALAMAKDYKKNYLDKLPATRAITKDNVQFLNSYPDLVDTDDIFFQVAYQDAKDMDDLIDRDGWSKGLVIRAIRREYLENRLWKDEQPVRKNPDWNRLSRTIAKRYPKIDVAELILNYQAQLYTGYYKRTGQWKELAVYTDKLVKRLAAQNPPDGFGINMICWHNFFLVCNDKDVLKKASGWMDLSLQLAAVKGDEAVQQLDTKANLLHKIGLTSEAIAIEEKALISDQRAAKRSGSEKGYFEDEFAANIKKMKKGLPTWPTK